MLGVALVLMGLQWAVVYLQSRRSAREDVLSLGTEGMYRPKTKETRAAYESLLGSIQNQFGDQPAVRLERTISLSAYLTHNKTPEYAQACRL
eukprot:8691525-Pyramimonas_sp.AAC.1